MLEYILCFILVAIVILKCQVVKQDAAAGYRVGREYFFHEAEPQACRYTDGGLIERLRESVTEMVDWKDTDSTWNYTIGCVLGELSGQLFPETGQERQEWEEECQKVLTWENKRHEKVLGKVVLQEK